MASSQLSLSASLKKGTSLSHKQAESVSFVKNFLRGRITVPVYAVLVANLYHVYKTMEEEMDEHGKEVMGELYLPEQLARAARLLDDWRFLTSAGEGGVNLAFPPITQSAREYCDRLKSISSASPILLISHAYTRYLGDLSGGQILQRCAKKAMSLPDSGEGSSFYLFPGIPEGAKVFKNTYRRLLDELSLTQAQVNDIVSEANVSFVLNMRIFEELDCLSGVEGASVRPLADALEFGTRWKTEGGDEKCPFGFVSKDGTNPHKKKKEKAVAEEMTAEGHGASRCPWPFVVFHDPKTFAADWQTWACVALAASFAVSTFSR